MKKLTRKNQPPQTNAEYFSIDLRMPFIFCFIEALALLVLCCGIYYFAPENTPQYIIGIIFGSVLAFYLASAGTICIVYTFKYSRVKKAERTAKRLDTHVYELFNFKIDMPYTIVDKHGKVKIINQALQNILEYRKMVCGIDLSEFCTIPANSIFARARNREDFFDTTIFDLPEDTPLPSLPILKLKNNRRYELKCYIMLSDGEIYYFIAFEDVEEILSMRELYDSESPCVCYISLDNLRELTQYVRADYRTASTQVQNILNNWAKDMGGLIREYDRDKYVVFITKNELDKQIANDFNIQQKIKSFKIGDNTFPITLSMGIASTTGTIRQKEEWAKEALDVAIGRGGNQVAVKRDVSNNYLFFGGTHKTMENNTSITSRVSGEILENQISNCSNLIIMGHATPDFDSIGSCVGMASFALSVRMENLGESITQATEKINIVVDKTGNTFDICANQLSPLQRYEKIFITKQAAVDIITAKTLLIICDVNNQYIYESPELSRTIANIAVIDHHRLTAPLTFNPFLQYIETTKSSASEIVAEIIEQSKFSQCLHKEEAELLLSGIMLDTNNFVRNTGSQTFNMSHFLYSRGAHTDVVREFFNEDLEEMLLTSGFEAKAKLYRGNIAIATMPPEFQGVANDRIIAAKVANNLLKIKGVEASFTLVALDGDVIISGRSRGAINVQLVLERLKGGGHFDMAGARVDKTGVENAVELLKDAVDDYYEYDVKGNS